MTRVKVHYIENKKTSGAFIDLSKAFGNVHHHTLLKKLGKIWYKNNLKIMQIK